MTRRKALDYFCLTCGAKLPFADSSRLIETGMKIRKTHVSAIALLPVLLLHCGSLVSESERIRRLYEYKNGATPQVTATDPADNTIASYNQTYIDITFSTEIDPATFTPQTAFGACTGSVQVSYDGFVNCIGGTVDASQNPRLRFTPTIFPKALGFQIRVTSAVLSTVGVPALPYTSPVGFKLGAPCGNQNCFFSYSTPLMSAAGNYSGIFLVRGGAHAGKYLVYTAGITTTTLIDPVAIASQAGPDMAAGGCAAPGTSTHNFLNNAGTKEVIIRGNSSTNTCLFDHAANTFANGPTFLSATGLGSYSFKPQNPLSSEYGNTLITTANNSSGVVRFAANDTTTGSVYTLTGGNANLGAHGIRATVGSAYAGKWLHFNSGTSVTVFTENPAAMSVGYGLGLGVGNGAASFEVFSGMRTGQVITIFGGNSNTIFAYDIANNTTVSGQPAAMPANVDGGALLLRQSGTATYDSPVILHGAGSAHATSIYNNATGNLELGPTTTGAILGGSAQVYVSNGQGGGGFLIVNGNGLVSTSVYLPGTRSFSGSRMPLSVPNAGAHAFRISGGPHDGRTLIVGAGGTRHTAIYDPLRHTMDAGPDTLTAISATGFSIPLSRGPHAGKVFTFHAGGSTTFSVYSPAATQYVSSGSLISPAITGAFPAINVGANAFAVANDDRILVMHGGGSNTTSYFNQSTGIISGGGGPTLGACGLSVGANVQYTRPTGSALKQFVMCTANTYLIFDHATPAFTGPTGMTSTGAGRQLYVIPSGPQAGNILVIHGGGMSTSSIINADTLAEGAGPTIGGVSNCGNSVVVEGGSQMLSIPFGSNAGKALLVVGGASGSATTCLYDPATNTFSPGPTVSSTGSPGFAVSNGSVAFRTFGGQYPTGFIVVTGSSKNVWSTYVP